MTNKHKQHPQTTLTINNITGYFTGTVTPIGNGAKIGCPKEYIGHQAYIIIIPKENTNNNTP
jgi:putative transposon-encoded protein